MTYVFHPEAANEYAESVAFYKSLRMELAIRFDKAVKAVIANACNLPTRHRIELPPAFVKQGFRDFLTT